MEHRFNITVEVLNCASNTIVKTHRLFSRFFFEEIIPALDALCVKLQSTGNCSFSCDFIASTTAALVPIKWFPDEGEFKQMLAISFMNAINKRFNQEVLGEVDDSIDYDNPMVPLLDFRNGENVQYIEWYESHFFELIYGWMEGNGGELIKRYGYCSNNSRYKLNIVITHEYSTL